MLKLDQINKILFNQKLLNICNNDIYYNNTINSHIKPINNNIYILFKRILNYLNFFFKNISIKIYFKLFINNNFLYSSIFNNRIENKINNNIYILDNNNSLKIYDNNDIININSKHIFKYILIRNKIILNILEATENHFGIFKKMSIFKFFNKNILLKKYKYNKYIFKNHKNFLDTNIHPNFKSKFKNLDLKKKKISLNKNFLYVSNIKRKKILIDNKVFYKINKTPLFYKNLSEYNKLLIKRNNKNTVKKFKKKVKKKYTLWADNYYIKNIPLYFINNRLFKNNKKKTDKNNYIFSNKIKRGQNYLISKINRSRSKLINFNNNSFYLMFNILLANKIIDKVNTKLIYLNLLKKKNSYLNIYFKYLNFINNKLIRNRYRNWFNKKYLYFINTSRIFLLKRNKNIIINNLNSKINNISFLKRNNNINTIKLMYDNKKKTFFYYYLKLIIFNNIITKNYKDKQKIFGVSNFFNRCSILINLFYKILYNINVHNLEENNYYKSINYNLGYNTQINNIIDYTDVIRFSSYFNGYNYNNNDKIFKKMKNKEINYKEELNYYINYLKEDLSNSYIFMINAYSDINNNNLYFKLLSKNNNKLKYNQDYESYYNYMDWVEYNLIDYRSLNKVKSYNKRKRILEYDICIKPGILKLLKLMEEAAKKKKRSVWRIFLEQFRVDNRIILKKNIKN